MNFIQLMLFTGKFFLSQKQNKTIFDVLLQFVIYKFDFRLSKTTVSSNNKKNKFKENFRKLNKFSEKLSIGKMMVDCMASWKTMFPV